MPAEADRKVRREEKPVGESRVTHEVKRRGVSAGTILPDIGKGCRKFDGLLRRMHVGEDEAYGREHLAVISELSRGGTGAAGMNLHDPAAFVKLWYYQCACSE